jgi:hypothetical protein
MNKKLNMFRQLLVALIMIAALGGLSSCEKYSWIPEKIDPEIPVHFQAEIQPIFNANCISCHGAIRDPDLRDGKSYDALIEGNYVNQPGNTSKLYTYMTNQNHESRSNATDEEEEKVLIWINQGALNN